jgi:hypothetical protein
MTAPDAFTCAITREVMEEPVVAADGHSYERSAIEQWLRRSARSPMTNAPLGSAGLIPNIALRKAIAEWRAHRPLALDPAALTVSSDVLGVGSFGTVVAGTLKTGAREQRVAVKTLAAATQAEQRKNLDAELRAHVVAQNGADGVCRLLGTCEQQGRVYLVMRRYECSLADRLIGLNGLNGLSDKEIRRIGYSLCLTLEQLHAAGVIVSDIKPANVLFDAYDRPVFADFGIAALVGRTTRIVPTSLKGTFNYMAPEALEPPFGVEADVWSMASLLVEMHTGKAPWSPMQMQQIVAAVLVRKRTPDVPDTMPAAETVRACFCFAPRDRPTAGALAGALLLQEVHEAHEAHEAGAALSQARQERQALRESESKHLMIARANMLSEANIASTVPHAGRYSMLAEANAREAAAVAQAAALREESETLKAQLAKAQARLEHASASCTKIFEISMMQGSAFVGLVGLVALRAEIEMIPSILVSEYAAVASVAAEFRAFVPSAPLPYKLRTFYTGHEGAPHALFAIIVSAEWGAKNVHIPSHMLHMIGPTEWIYHNNGDRPTFNPTRNIGMNLGDVFVHSEPRQPGARYPSGPHAYTITPNTKSFGICVGGKGYRGDYCMDGLVVGRLKNASRVLKTLLGPGSFPRYFQWSLPR